VTDSGRKVFNVVIAFLVSIAAWVFVVYNYEPMTLVKYVDVPVDFTGERELADRGLAVNEASLEEVTVTLSQKRVDGASISAEDISVVADVSECVAGANTVMLDVSGPSGTKVSLDGYPSVLLHHAVPNHEQELPLKGTYWRLKELDGKPVKSFPGQPEAHLILREKGEAAGSDGCNNFFMGWESSDGSISFTPGGATLRLCPNGEEQARKMLQMFPSVKTWNISGGQLELRSDEKLEAVFEAVEM
jgi:heat shock protein HslJ